MKSFPETLDVREDGVVLEIDQADSAQSYGELATQGISRVFARAAERASERLDVDPHMDVNGETFAFSSASQA